MSVRFTIGGGQPYSAESLDQVSLSDIMLFEAQVSEFLHAPVTWADLELWSTEIQKLKPAERKRHPRIVLFTATAVWAARRVAGEGLSFAESIDFPVKDLVFLPDPQDHKESANPQKARAPKKRARAGKAGSGRQASVTSG